MNELNGSRGSQRPGFGIRMSCRDLCVTLLQRGVGLGERHLLIEWGREEKRGLRRNICIVKEIMKESYFYSLQPTFFEP